LIVKGGHWELNGNLNENTCTFPLLYEAFLQSSNVGI